MHLAMRRLRALCATAYRQRSAIARSCKARASTWRNLMSLFVWIVLGLIAGFIASKIINRTGEGIVIDVLLGVVGAIVGGWLFNAFGMRGVSGLNLYSMLVAVVGAAVVLVVYHALFGSRSRRFF
jgi:uncharacterized membrane protein YeaQ/YmgE (transglycosylase-associated protein family)